MHKQKEETQDHELDNQYPVGRERTSIRKPTISRLDQFKNFNKIIINVSMTQYPVISEVAHHLNWKIQNQAQNGDWDIFWTDYSVDSDILIRMHLFQKINHFPGIQSIARKNLLALNLTKMKKYYPTEYNFFPVTFLLPQQYHQFREFFESKPKGKARTYIVKPEADCQGRGIFLTRKLQDLENGKHYVIQRYIAKPLLLDGLKFDFRIYVLICGTDPLRLYMFKEGLVRFATELYQDPANTNLDNLCMHLTNYAINKQNPKFLFNSNAENMGTGHKRSLTCVWKQLEEKGLNVLQLQKKIKDLIIKTIIPGLPLMKHQYKCCQPEDYNGNICFHILGLDIMLNEKQEPFMLEVNHAPSFRTDTPLDQKIKFNLIKDTLILMNINTKQKTDQYNRQKKLSTDRLLTGKRQICDGQYLQQKIKQAQGQRDLYENSHLGGYEKIYPLNEEEQKYAEMIETANQIYYEETNAIRNKNEKEKLFSNQIRKKQIYRRYESQARLREKEEQKQQERKEQILQTIKSTQKSQNLETRKTDSNMNVENSKLEVKTVEKKEKQEKLFWGRNEIMKNKVQRREGDKQKMTKLEQVAYEKIQMKSTFSSHKYKSHVQQNRKSYKSSLKQYANTVDSHSSLSEVLHHRSQYQSMKSRSKKPLFRSEEKSNMIEILKKQEKLENDKIFMTGKKGYVMPKVFCLNLELEKQKEESELKFITTSKKLQNILCHGV